MGLGCSLKEVKANAFKGIKELVETKNIKMENDGTIRFNQNKFKDLKQNYNIAKSVQNKIKNWLAKEIGPKFTENWTSIIQNNNEVIIEYKFPDYVEKAYQKKFETENTSFEPSVDYFSNDVYEVEDIVVPSYEKYIQYKENLISRVEQRLNQIDKSKKENSSDLQIVKNLIKQENLLKDRLEGHPEEGIKGLKDELIELKNTPPIDKFLFYTEADLKRLEVISNSSNEQDLKEAETIIRFYEEIGTFSTKRDNPLFKQETMFDENGNLILPKDVQNKLLDLKEKVISYKNKIYKKEKSNLEDTVNNLSKFKETFENSNINYDNLFHKEEGLKDINWIDMFVMDITNGIMSSNGIVPQAIVNIVQDSFEKNLVYAKSVEKRVNDSQLQVEKELSKLGYDLKVPGLKGVSYDLFRAKNNNGQSVDSIVQRYTQDFFIEKNKMLTELNSKLEIARKTEDPNNKTILFRDAFTYRDNWYKKNTIVLDIRKLEEFKDFVGDSYIDDISHKENLISILGKQGYEEEVNKQIRQIKNYQIALEVYKDKLLTEEDDITLSKEGQKKLDIWEKRNNPIEFLNSYYDNRNIENNNLKLNSSMHYNYSIPRKTIGIVKVTENGLSVSSSDKETGYYDKNFETIENNSILKDFHNLLSEVTQKVHDIMPPEIKKDFNINSLPQLEKSITEILFDPNISFLQRISKAAREMYERILKSFGIKVQSKFSYANVDPITGLPDYKINSEFLQSNKQEIEKRYQIESLRLKKALGYTLDTNIGKFKTFNWNSLNEEVLSILEENIDPKIISTIRGKNNLEIFNLLKEGITHEVVQEQSFDIPKILKLFSNLAMEYQARQEVLPLVEMMKKHYEEIKKPSINNVGQGIVNSSSKSTRLDGERKNAIRQINSYFERVVLGNYSSKNEFGDTRLLRKGKLGITGVRKVDLLTSKLQTVVTGRILTKEEKIIEEKVKDLLLVLKEDMSKASPEEMSYLLKLKNQLENQLDNIGKRFTWTKALDALFNFIRFKGLGWNLSSQTTNFLEGQIANFVTAASGLYFKPENIYKANQIVQSSFLKNSSFGYIETDNAKKTRALMDRYRVLQDASNELQKASSKSTFSQFSKFSPFEMMKRVEYLNQSPLMISILMDTIIEGKNGNTSSVWEALTPEGELLDNFKTENNINNWEKADGDKYRSFSSLLRKVIVNTHGDYDELRGNMASEYITGKALLMFKRWMSRQIYNRFGVEQVDLETGIKNFKGRYRSHSTASGALQGALIGFGGLGIVGAGPLGIIIGGAVGTTFGKFYGNQTGLGFIQESALIGKQMILNMLKIPVNSLTGKEIIKDIDYNKILISGTDLKNYKANIMDLSIQLAFIAFILMAKGLFWDDEDDEESKRRKTHNYLVNKFMQLSSQASMYLNPVDLYTNSVGNLPIMRFFTEVQETAKAAQKALEGDDVITSGPNTGESNLYNKASKAFLPGLFKSEVGFEGQMQRQFKPSPFDKWFQSEEKESKEEVKEKKVKAKTEYIKEDLSEEEKKVITKELNKIFKKRKGETYKDLYDRVNTEDFDENLDTKFDSEG